MSVLRPAGPDIVTIPPGAAPPLRVLVIRRCRRRHLRLARRLFGLGWPFWLIARATTLPQSAIRRAIAGAGAGLWGAHAGLIRSELAKGTPQ